jgi:hypothetical protein
MWIIIIEKIEENNIKTNRLTIWIWNLWIILSYKYNNSQKKIVEVDLILKYQYVKNLLLSDIYFRIRGKIKILLEYNIECKNNIEINNIRNQLWQF